VLSFDPRQHPSLQHDFRIPLSHSAPFHIASIIRYGAQWGRARGAALQGLEVYWTDGQTVSCQGSNSCFVSPPAEIRVGGAWENPDQWDTPVLLHEVGHWVTRVISRSDSQGGPHTAKHRNEPRLAWSEGLATYIGQQVRNNPWYVDQMWSGRSSQRVDDLQGVHLGLDGTKHSEAVVTGFLWDLYDGVDQAESDLVSGWDQRTLNVLRVLRNTNQLDRGVANQVDTADFVYHLVCSAPQPERDRVRTLLSGRSQINWLADPNFCN